MDKKMFVGIMDILKYQIDRDESIDRLLNVIAPDACNENIISDSDGTVTSLIILLKSKMNDCDVIENFIYYSKFGEVPLKITEEDKTKIVINTNEELYDYLNSKK